MKHCWENRKEKSGIQRGELGLEINNVLRFLWVFLVIRDIFMFSGVTIVNHFFFFFCLLKWNAGIANSNHGNENTFVDHVY